MVATDKICSVLLCVLFAGLCACTSSTSADGISDRLAEAEKCIWIQPDSALHLLEAIPHAERLTGKLQADYALLLSHARYRCDIPVTSDSLINIAVDYYRNSDNMDRRGRVWYVKGGILEENNALSQAVLAYKEAESCIPGMKDIQTVSCIYSSLGYLNNISRNHELAKTYYEKAFQASLKIKDTNSRINDLVNLYNQYYILGEENNMEWCIEQLEQIVTDSTDSVLLAKAYHNIAVQKMEAGYDKQAEKLFLRALQLTRSNPSYKTLSQLSELYIRTGHRELAVDLYEKAGNIPDLSVRAIIYKSKYQDCLEKKEYQMATHYADLYMVVADSFYTDHLHKEILEIQKKYDHVELLYQKSRLQLRWLFTLFLLIITIGCFVYAFWYYRKMKNQKYCKLQTEIVMLQNKFIEINLKSAQQDNEIILLQEQIEQKKKELEVLYKRMKLMFGSNNQLLHHDDLKAIQVAFKIIGNRMCDLSKERESLKHWLNISKENFAERLENSYPILKVSYIDICCLTVLGLSISEIAQIMGVNDRTVERYMEKICIEVGFQQRGKKGFIEFLNTFLCIQR